MKRVQLVFPSTTEVWNFLTLNKMPTAEVGDITIQGFFADNEIEQACSSFGAAVQEYKLPEIKVETVTALQQPATTKAKEEAVKLVGKSGKTYKGALYNKETSPGTLPEVAIVCLSNSTFQNGAWHHAINAVYQTDNVAEELQRFRSRSDISHLIVIPINPAEPSRVNKVDDLARKYIHK